MHLKKLTTIPILLILTILPLTFVSISLSSPPPTLSISPSSGDSNTAINLYGTGWTSSPSVSVYWDSVAPENLIALIPGSHGQLSVTLPEITTATVGTHTIIAVQGVNSATAQFDVTAVPPPNNQVSDQVQNLQNQITNLQSQLSSSVSTIESKIDGIKSLQILNFYSGQYNFTSNNVAPGTDITASKPAVFIITVNLNGLSGDDSVQIGGDGVYYKSYNGDNSQLTDTVIFAGNATNIGRYDTEGNAIGLHWTIMVLGTPGTVLTVH